MCVNVVYHDNHESISVQSQSSAKDFKWFLIFKACLVLYTTYHYHYVIKSEDSAPKPQTNSPQLSTVELVRQGTQGAEQPKLKHGQLQLRQLRVPLHRHARPGTIHRDWEEGIRRHHRLIQKGHSSARQDWSRWSHWRHGHGWHWWHRCWDLVHLRPIHRGWKTQSLSLNV